MILKIIACHVFYRDLSYKAALSQNISSTVWLPQGLHNTPQLLKKSLQDEIDKTELELQNSSALYHKKSPNAIVLGYGLCSNGVIGLKSRSIPLVIPRTDDCIGIFLGSQKRYLDYFNSHPGIYWYNSGWIETTTMPSMERYELLKAEYNEKYGEENAEFLLEEEMRWINNYHGCTYIKSPIYDKPEYIDFTKKCADGFGWEFDEIVGSETFIENMVNGHWNDEHFLVCPPEHTIVANYDGKKLDCV